MSSLELELAWLVRKVGHDAQFIEQAEAYYEHRHREWSPGLAATFKDFLMRKRDQYMYEMSRVEKLGLRIASGREHIKLDI